MGRERNLVYDDRITDFTPTTKIKGEVNREGIRRMDTTRMGKIARFSRIISLFPSQMFTRINNLAILLPYLQFKQLQMKF
jgi:DNA (cytosine-5)-methyltransferase 1